MLYLGSDHRGFKLKENIKKYFETHEIEYIDCGTDSDEITHYPLIAKKVLEQMNPTKDLAVLICGSGVGMTIVANKYKGIKAGCCISVEAAKEARQHNAINVLALSADTLKIEDAISIIETWKSTQPLTGRYEERRKMIEEIEKENMK